MSATKIRQHFGLSRQRFLTIARDPRFTNLLPDDELPLTSVPRVLKRLYELRNDPRGLSAYRRHIQAQKRVKRAEERAQNEELVSQYVDYDTKNRQGDITYNFEYQIPRTSVSEYTNAYGKMQTQLETGVYKVKRRNAIRPETENDFEINRVLKLIMRSLSSKVKRGDYVSIVLKADDLDDEGRNIGKARITSVRFMPTARGALAETLEKLDKLRDDPEYDAREVFVDSVIVMVRRNNPENGAGGAAKRRTKANEIWCVPGEWNTQTNCFYVSWCMLQNRERFLTQYAMWLEGTQGDYPNFNDEAKSKKKETRRALKDTDEKMLSAFTDMEMAQN